MKKESFCVVNELSGERLWQEENITHVYLGALCVNTGKSKPQVESEDWMCHACLATWW